MPRGFLLLLLLVLNVMCCNSAMAQVADPRMAPIQLNTAQLAQRGPAAPTPNILPTDATRPYTGQERGVFENEKETQFRIYQRLPKRLWFNSVTEVSQRLDTNVLFTSRDAQADYVFRALPNISVGYNVLENTSIYGNYFLIKDVFATHGFLTNPTTQSLSLGFRQNVPVGSKTNLQFDFQARELWQAQNLRQADLLPAVNVTHFLNPSTILFSSMILQLRGKEFFTGGQREIDPFFSAGAVYRKGAWVFSVTDTFVCNFRNRATAIPNQSNLSMIMDIEAARPISKKHPELMVFWRAEPIWNWDSNYAPGLSGFNFRLFSGLRLSLAKPAYHASINKLKKDIIKTEEEAEENQAPAPASNQNQIPMSVPLKNPSPVPVIEEQQLQPQGR